MSFTRISKLNPIHRPSKSGGHVIQPTLASLKNPEKTAEGQRKTAHIQLKQNAFGEPAIFSPKKAIENRPLENTLNASKGSGAPLPDSIRQEMESGFGNDFSKVKIHTGSHAVQMNQELSAKAFTHGNDIYFNKGTYNPSSKDGKRLLAHELTHTVQQGNTAPKSIQMAKDNVRKTHYGEFYTNDYQLINHSLFPNDVEPKFYGAQMELYFKANNTVNSKQIGLLQTVNSKAPIGKKDPRILQDQSGNLYSHSNQKKRANKKGAFIDQAPNAVNPLYASTGAPGMGKTSTEPDYGEHGEHYKTTKGELHTPTKDAWIYDTPFMNPAYYGSEFNFETTALSLEGADKNTYFGSVKWGWKLDSSGKHSLIPLKVVSNGAPSNSFFEAAEAWNKSKGGKQLDQKTDQIPIVDVKLLKEDYTLPPIKIPMSSILLKKGTRVQILDPLYSYSVLSDVTIKVVDGPNTGLKGKIPFINLKDESK